MPVAVRVISSRRPSITVRIVPSSVFSATLPVKPSVTTTSAAFASRSRPSVLPREVEGALGQERVRLERELVPLLRLLADREQAHLGVREAEDLLGEDRAHVGELEQVLGAGVGVGAAVEQHRRAVARRDRHGDRRAHHAREAADLEQAGGEHRAGVAGRDHRVGPPLGDRAAGCDERAVRLRAHGLGRLLVHRDHLLGDDELEPARVERRGAVEHRDDPVRRRLERAGDDLVRAAVAAHGVDGNPDGHGLRGWC